MILGEYSPATLPRLASIIGFVAIFTVYYLAVYVYDQEKPLPHTWISNCAHHYP